MLIDWFTVGAQALNFLLLLWLLKRFLYRPILRAIDAREARVAAELAQADATMAEAQRQRQEFEGKRAELEAQRAALLRQATEAAQAEGQRLVATARETAAALQAKRQEALRQEAQSLYQELGRRVRGEAFALARQALADLAGVGLEERMVEVLVRQLRALDEAQRKELAAGLGSGTPVVRSAFELPAAQRDAVTAALREVLGVDGGARFETVPELVSGLEVLTAGQKLAWSLGSYLGALQERVDELLDGSETGAAGPAEGGTDGT